MNKKDSIINVLLTILVPVIAWICILLVGFVQVGFDFSQIATSAFWSDKIINFVVLYAVYLVCLFTRIYDKKNVNVDCGYKTALENFTATYERMQTDNALWLFGLKRYCEYEYKERVTSHIDACLSVAEVSLEEYGGKYKNNNASIIRDKKLTYVQKRFLLKANNYIYIEQEDAYKIIHGIKKQTQRNAVHDNRGRVILNAMIGRIFASFVLGTALSALVLTGDLNGDALSIIVDIFVKGIVVLMQAWGAYRTCERVISAEIDLRNENVNFMLGYLAWVSDKDLTAMKEERENAVALERVVKKTNNRPTVAID